MERNYVKNPPARKKTFTKIKSLHAINRDGTRTSQKIKVLNLLEESEPLSIREISKKLGFEISAVCRTLNDLQANVPPLVVVAFTAPSKITGKIVNHYCHVNWVNPKTGNQLTLLP